MRILALDTTGQTASVAIMDRDKLVAEFTLNYKLTHSQTILPMIAEICEKAEVALSSIDYIACAVGPGSFTGLRIGAATAKGLALALKRKIIPVPTLEALAYNIFETDNIICPIMDARRNQVYAAFYQWIEGKLCPLTPMMAEDMDVILAQGKVYGRKVIFLGDGVPVHLEKILQNKDFLTAPPHCALQRGATVAALAMKKTAAAIDGNQLELIYLRKSQAEREREERLAQEEEAAHD